MVKKYRSPFISASQALDEQIRVEKVKDLFDIIDHMHPYDRNLLFKLLQERAATQKRSSSANIIKEPEESYEEFIIRKTALFSTELRFHGATNSRIGWKFLTRSGVPVPHTGFTLTADPNNPGSPVKFTVHVDEMSASGFALADLILPGENEKELLAQLQRLAGELGYEVVKR